MRIASLVPHATELLYALGVGEQLIAVTHECDYPAAARELPRITRDVLPAGLSAAEIDAAVREHTSEGRAIYELDVAALTELEPDLIVTQALCPVCAVSYEDVAKVAKRIRSKPRLIALDPKTLGETLGDVRTLAQATASGERGRELIKALASRIDRVKLAVRGRPRPRVAALEWLDPLYVAGHWTPQLIELAGGEDVLGLAGEHSERVSWQQLAAAQAEVLVVMPCGYDAPQARLQARQHARKLAGVGAREVLAVNASAYFSRPGPRLLDGLELLAHILHPEQLPHPPAGSEALPVELDGVIA